jgi:hypothetical protein
MRGMKSGSITHVICECWKCHGGEFADGISIAKQYLVSTI